MHSEPDFESYTEDELIDIYENIDRQSYPERFNKVKRLLSINDSGSTATEYIEEAEALRADPIKKAQKINNFFDSLSDLGSAYHSDGCGGFDGGGCDGGGE